MSGNTISRAWGGGRGAMWDKFSTEVVETAALHEFDENDRFFTAVTHILVMLSDIFLHTFHHKKDTKDGF
jgi:hypothetical protein